MEALIILFLTAIFLLFLVSFFVYAYRSIRKDKAREEFYRAVHSILGRAESDEQALAQISIIYRKVAQRHPQITAACRDTIAFMEDFLYCANSNGLERFRRLYKFELSDDDMRRVARMVDLMKEREPFTSVSSKYANLLNTLRRALGSNNSDLGISTWTAGG